MTRDSPVGAHGRAPLYLQGDAPVPQDGAAPLRNRRSIRLRGHDYSQAGAYFVTLCILNRECLFGEIVDEAMRLNHAGRIVQSEWMALPGRFSGVEVDAFIVMPNHAHGILWIHPVGAPFMAPDGRGGDHPDAIHQGAMNRAPTLGETNHPVGAPFMAPDGRGGDHPDAIHQGAMNRAPTLGETNHPAGAPFMAPDGLVGDHPAAIHQGAMNRAPTLGEIIRAFKAVATRRLRQSGLSEFAWQRNYYEHIIRSEESLVRIREYILNNPLQWALDQENPVNASPHKGGRR